MNKGPSAKKMIDITDRIDTAYIKYSNLMHEITLMLRRMTDKNNELSDVQREASLAMVAIITENVEYYNDRVKVLSEALSEYVIFLQADVDKDTDVRL